MNAIERPRLKHKPSPGLSSMRALRLAIPMLMVAARAFATDFELGSHGILSIEVPDKWTVNRTPATQPDGTLVGYQFTIKPTVDAHAGSRLTLILAELAEPNREAVRQQVLLLCERYVEGSVEKKKNLKDFSLAQGYGAYCVFTDASLVGKEPGPNDYKVMGAGLIHLSRTVRGPVSIFADDAESGEFKAMVQILNTLKLRAPAK